jgi:mRNA interferase HigB
LRIISKTAIHHFSKIRPDALAPLLHWYAVARRAIWHSIAEVNFDFPHADVVGIFTDFNIAGKKYRLIAIVKYRWQIVYIRHILTHAEYNKEKWKK